MPVSTDNQDYKNPENAGKQNENKGGEGNKSGSSANEQESKLTSDDLKGKKVDADVTKETDRPADT